MFVPFLEWDWMIFLQFSLQLRSGLLRTKVLPLHLYLSDESVLKLIQVDIGGHPPFPNGSKQFSGHFGNLLFLAGFNFRGHFEGPNEGFSRSRFSMIAEGIIEPPK
jgi:hypothetical protein